MALAAIQYTSKHKILKILVINVYNNSTQSIFQYIAPFLKQIDYSNKLFLAHFVIDFGYRKILGKEYN